jgi:hypothetical protein
MEGRKLTSGFRVKNHKNYGKFIDWIEDADISCWCSLACMKVESILN